MGEQSRPSVIVCDVDGAHRAGLRSAWLDRDGRAYPPSFSSPDVVATDLVDLTEKLC